MKSVSKSVCQGFVGHICAPERPDYLVGKVHESCTLTACDLVIIPIRDIRDTLASAKLHPEFKIWSPGYPGPCPVQHTTPLSYLITQRRRYLRAVYESRDTESVIVKYEDFMGDPIGYGQLFLSKIGLVLDDEVIQRCYDEASRVQYRSSADRRKECFMFAETTLHGSHNGDIGYYADVLTKEEEELVKIHCGDIQKKYGYGD